MNNIIKKAIKGGWRYEGIEIFNEELFAFGSVKYKPIEKLLSEAILDPLFWQALDKASGWEGKWVHPRPYKVGMLYGQSVSPNVCLEEWQHHALRFHEINLVEGWDAAIAYLENLLK